MGKYGGSDGTYACDLYRQVNHHHDIPVSQICNRTTVSVSVSITRFVIMLAPTVEVIWAGLKAPLQKRVTRDVLPTPWEPRTTILASREDDISSFVRGVVVFIPLFLSFLAIGR